ALGDPSVFGAELVDQRELDVRHRLPGRAAGRVRFRLALFLRLRAGDTRLDEELLLGELLQNELDPLPAAIHRLDVALGLGSHHSTSRPASCDMVMRRYSEPKRVERRISGVVAAALA